jgi:NADP-dependent 3-hydroxy acid dehydrogenase YdfG
MITVDLNGTVALVTGASSGIGEAVAIALDKCGAKVCIAARRSEQLETVAKTIRDGGGTVFLVVTDLTVKGAPEDLIQRCVEHFGRLDIVINNAGIMLLGPALGAPLEEWKQMLSINVEVPIAIAHAALPHLKDSVSTSSRGVVDLVNISSAAGRKARAGSAVYNLTKFGLGAFSEALRQEVTKSNIRVSLVEPGAVATELRSHMRPEIEALSGSRFADVERLQPADIAEIILFILSQPRRVALNEILVRPTDQAD